MRFRRRRKRRLQWFPPLGVQIQNTNEPQVGFQTFNIPVLANATTNNFEFPLTFDFGQEDILAQANPNTPNVNFTLADIMNSGWRVRRIVGKVYATYVAGNTPDTGTFQGENDAPPGCIFSIGLMVRNVGTGGLPTNVNVSLLDQDDYDDPWIWRRTWVLGQDLATGRRMSASVPYGAAATANIQPTALGSRNTTNQVAFAQFPQSNAHYGDAMSGTHLDAKTNRIVGPEDRLFIHLTTKSLPIQQQNGYATDGQVVGVYDLRMLGAIQRMTNRRNASR